MAMKRALVILAEGAEEMEAIIPIDVLRRGGVKVTVAGLEGASPVKCSRDVVINPDSSLDEAISSGPFDAVILPGGLKGAENLAASQKVKGVLTDQEKSGRIVAAICAGPTALKAHGIALGKQVTSYPATKEKMMEGDLYKYLEDRVVVDGNLVTSRGPGTAFEFALTLVEKLVDKSKSDEVKKALLVQ